jgi:hypothetical protein
VTSPSTGYLLISEPSFLRMRRSVQKTPSGGTSSGAGEGSCDDMMADGINNGGDAKRLAAAASSVSRAPAARSNLRPRPAITSHGVPRQAATLHKGPSRVDVSPHSRMICSSPGSNPPLTPPIDAGYQDGTYTGAGSINVSGPGVWVTFVRGKERSAADSVQAEFEELVDELWPGAQEAHRVAKAALAAEREREAAAADAGGSEEGAAPASGAETVGEGKGDFDDELRKELEELRLEREVKAGRGGGGRGGEGEKGKTRRPPSLISAFSRHPTRRRILVIAELTLPSRLL